MKFKKIEVILINGDVEKFENCEWNESSYGISLTPHEGKYLFWPFYQVHRVNADV